MPPDAAASAVSLAAKPGEPSLVPGARPGPAGTSARQVPEASLPEPPPSRLPPGCHEPPADSFAPPVRLPGPPTGWEPGLAQNRPPQPKNRVHRHLHGPQRLAAAGRCPGARTVPPKPKSSQSSAKRDPRPLGPVQHRLRNNRPRRGHLEAGQSGREAGGEGTPARPTARPGAREAGGRQTPRVSLPGSQRGPCVVAEAGLYPLCWALLAAVPSFGQGWDPGLAPPGGLLLAPSPAFPELGTVWAPLHEPQKAGTTSALASAHLVPGPGSTSLLSLLGPPTTGPPPQPGPSSPPASSLLSSVLPLPVAAPTRLWKERQRGGPPRPPPLLAHVLVTPLGGGRRREGAAAKLCCGGGRG
ncbi:basic proline-rich protein-like [Gracilinanus agilis]|uniref:basic proline-rich protein-like n=1 Tax=Gracilinanus agilis TaxID=191870 RepID=UPI001CFED290|nr:basic proline-rich protein-like [Gracilinanus agilis]